MWAALSVLAACVSSLIGMRWLIAFELRKKEIDNAAVAAYREALEKVMARVDKLEFKALNR